MASRAVTAALSAIGVAVCGLAVAMLASCDAVTCDEKSTCVPAVGADDDGGTRDGNAGTFCSGVDAFFCADYDEPGSDPSSRATTENDARLFVAPDDGGSAPNALQIVLPALPGGAGRTSAGYGTDAGTPTHFHLELDMRVDSASPGGEVALLSFLAPSSQLYLLVDPMSPTSLSLFEQTVVDDEETRTTGHEYGSFVDARQWHHYALDVSYLRSTYRLSVDGAAGATGALAIGQQLAPVTFYVTAGFYFPASQTAEAHVHIDNVVLVLDP